MTRCVRDLREIINVSRLSVRDCSSDEHSSDSDITLGDEEDSDDLADYISCRPSSAMVKSSFQTAFLKRPASAMGGRISSASPNACDSRPYTAPPIRHQVHSNTQQNNRITSGRQTVPVENNNSILQPFPNKFTPVPPIGKSNEKGHPLKRRVVSPCKSDKTVSSDESCIDIQGSIVNLNNDTKKVAVNSDEQMLITKSSEELNNVSNNDGNNGCQPDKMQQNFDNLFQFLDGTVVASWLEECNKVLSNFEQKMCIGNNFVDFAHFFLTQLSLPQYCELLDVEFSILLDHFKYAFHSGCTDGHVKESELYMLAKAVMKEYPSKLKKRKRGPKLLLDIIIVFCNGKTDAYRKLLKNIDCHSLNKQNIQWLLAMRAFGLISFITGILNFHENVLNLKEIFMDAPLTVSDSHLDVNKLITQAVHCGYLDVLDYFYTNHETAFNSVADEKKRNLVGIAVSCKGYEVLHYLLKLPLKINVNGQSENGSTALHCAVSYSDVALASILLEHGVDVNAWNEQSEGATALHMAVILGDVEMVKVLLKHGADKTSQMGVPAESTPLSLACDMDHTEIIALLMEGCES